ncbi:MAG: phosphoribosyl-AMP cyclohydrolase, partial [Desulfosporosinus sp.]
MDANVIAVLDLSKIRWDSHGLVPAIVQDVETKDVLMLAYMNEESLRRTLLEHKTCFYSRSRQSLWLKGETSGHFQEIIDIKFDCDQDALLLTVKQTGMACHENHFSCFHYGLTSNGF